MEKISVEDYQKYFDEFNPDSYDPKEWARIAKDAGMKYAVMTSKHHDGFCLFDSKLTNYKSTATKCGRDLVREYLDAFRGAGLKAGLYYSVIDWHHPDYPHYGDNFHPMRDNEAFKDAKHDFENYLDYMHGQVRELCTDYGKLDLLFFDFSYGKMSGEKWRGTELMKMVYDLQPGIVVNNRLEASGDQYGSIVSNNPSPYAGDFVTPEQIIPPNGIRRPNGEPVLWESCLTMNNNWGFSQFDKCFYPPEVIIRKLVEIVSKGGNMLLNVGPDARGRIPEESVKLLQTVGKWMRGNGASIYGCGGSGRAKPDFGRLTAKGEKFLYLHVTEQTICPVYIQGIKPADVKKVRLLSTGAELSTENTWVTAGYPDYLFIRLDEHGRPSYSLPDPMCTVIEIELK